MNGFLLIDKPQGPSSFEVIRRLRKSLKIKKIGHSGTLDPEASGLMIIGIGAGTRMLPFIPAEPKQYEFLVRFGQETDTLDHTGAVLKCDGAIPREDAVATIIPRFLGEQLQSPPRYSSVKIDGVRAYSLARKGKQFEPRPRSCYIYSLEMLACTQAGEARFTVRCSAGTYVRALARDIAAALGTVAHTRSIRRSAIGNFSIKQAVALDDVFESTIIAVSDFVPSSQSIQLDQQQKKLVLHGMDIAIEKKDSLLFAFDEMAQIVAVLCKAKESYHPIRVFGEPPERSNSSNSWSGAYVCA